MARTYGKLYTAIWRDDDYRGLGMAEQWLYEALMSQPDLSAAGVIPLRLSRWARLTKNATVETVETALRMLDREQYVLVDWETEEVLIRTFIRHDGGTKNPKMRVAISTAIAGIESPRLRARAQAELDKAAGHSESDHQSDYQSHRQSDADPITDPIPSSQQPHPTPTTSSRSRILGLLDQFELPPAAAAAFVILIEHRIETSRTPIDNVLGYAKKIVTDELGSQEAAIHAAATAGKDAQTIASTLLGVPTAKKSAAWYSDPDCDDCPGDGWISTPQGAAPCDCRRADPYGATIHQLRGAS